jgi:hypothetical protein
VIIGDESWIYEYYPETRRQSEEWKHGDSPCGKKAPKSHSKIKIILIVFFFVFPPFWDIRGVVHHKFVPQGLTVNAEFYVEVLKCLREHVQRVRPELWAGKNWILHHDNAPTHSALIVREFFAKNDMITTDHPSYSPDLAPCDFFCTLK